MTLVIDASALLDLGEHTGLAARLLAKYALHAPRLVAWEVGNVIHGKKAGEFPSRKARQAVVADLVGPLEMADQIGKLAEIGAVCEKYGLTFYDAAYLQLAIDLDAPLLTEDKDMHSAAVKALGAKWAWRLKDAERDAASAAP